MAKNKKKKAKDAAKPKKVMVQKGPKPAKK